MYVVVGDPGDQIGQRDLGVPDRDDDDPAILLAYVHGRVALEARGLQDGRWDADEGTVAPFADGGAHGWLLDPWRIILTQSSHVYTM